MISYIVVFYIIFLYKIINILCYFNIFIGSKLVTASADSTSRVYNTMTGACHAILSGHEGEISKVAFNPQGSRILTASSDKSARIWETETGDCLQVCRDDA